jgi:hypothetical protein
VFSLLDFLILEDGLDRLFRNVSEELSFHVAQYLRRADISHDDLAFQTMVWLHMVWFQAVWFGTS